MFSQLTINTNHYEDGFLGTIKKWQWQYPFLMANILYPGDFTELIALHDLTVNGHSYKRLEMFSTLTKPNFSIFTPESDLKLIVQNSLAISGK